MHQNPLNTISVFANKYVSARADEFLLILNFGNQESGEACRSYFSQEKWAYQTIGLDLEGDADILLKDLYEWKEITSQSVDVFVLENLFERVEHFWAIAQEIFRVLKPGGICRITLPSLSNAQILPAGDYQSESNILDDFVRRIGFEVLENSVSRDDCEHTKDSCEGKAAILIAKKPARSASGDWTVFAEQRKSLPPPVYKVYSVPQDVAAEAESGSCWSKQLALVGKNKSVIDFGCAGGYFAKMLLKNGCQVTGVELNPEAAKVAEKYCQRVLVLDIDDISIADVLKDEKYDVAVFGDVLEHLRDPWRVLREVNPILYPGGYVVASIPNIAHGAVRLSLLQGDFNYREDGILDNTHLRFFTRKTVEELFENSGYFIDTIDRTRSEIFADTTAFPTVRRAAFAQNVIESVEKDPESETIQFIVRASPLSWENRYALEKQRTDKLFEEIEHLNAERSRLQRSEAWLELELKNLKIMKANIESSKFWKLRQKWISFKHWLSH